MRRTRPIEERFLAQVAPEPNSGCWLWMGAVTSFGHGVIGRGARGEGAVRAHRLAWELYRGQIPEGQQVNHVCDVPSCVNPDHLYVGDQRENMLDVSERRRFSTPAAKIDETCVAAIRTLRARGVPSEALSEAFGISTRQVRKIVARERWRHVG